jgi:glucosylceramidase
MNSTPSHPSRKILDAMLRAFSSFVPADHSRSSGSDPAHLLSFDILPHSSALDKIVSIFFSITSSLFAKNTRVGTPPSHSIRFGLFFAPSARPTRINTCRKPSKQTALSAFKINIYEKSRQSGRLWLTIFPVMACLILLLSPMARAQRQNDSASRKPLRIEVFQSSEELHESLQEKPAITFGATRPPELTITVNDAVKYQQIDGFGASLTDSSAWLLWNKLSESQRNAALQMLFSREKGIGLSVLREPMGASDFALEDYSYDDMPRGETDPELKHFSIDHDRAYIIPILRDAFALNPQLKIIASPWSPPGWMKTSGSMIQGALLPSAYAPLAKYFVKFVQAYEAAGIPVYAVTIQNEPLNIPNDYPGLGMTAGEQTVFLRDYLAPAFRDAGIKTRIMIFDHNWDLLQFPITVLNDPTAAASAAGTAIHCYGGSVTAQAELHSRFPNKDIWLTECSGGEWQKGKLLEQQVRLIIGATRNWAKSVVLWNLALNQNHEPYLGGCTTCRGVITVEDSASPSRVIETVDFTALAHASKYVQPGAYRIESNSFGEGSLEDVAFKNPDGSIVLVVLNSSNGPTTFNIGWKDNYASYKLGSSSVATFRWAADAKEH